MLVNWAYIKRDTLIHRLDPRSRIILMLCALLAVGFIPGRGTGIGIWDARIILVFLALSFLQIFLARLTWRQTRRFWIVITVVAVVLSLVTLFTGRGAAGTYDVTAEHVLWSPVTGIGWLDVALRISAERLSYLIAQIMRVMTSPHCR
jgi:energy-coupling factor transporter transmembrane protein EcfT